jgi:16S rRNA (adenine1518-N6/adenine1519-N6)-dimethyltransferase
MKRREPFIRQKKSLGQVFLNTDWPVQKVVDTLHRWQVKSVIEIGPGGGILTRALLAEGFHVSAVERDDRFVERLQSYYSLHEKQLPGTLELIPNDVLKVDLGRWIDQYAQAGAVAVVGNIPYNISSPILMWVLPHISRLKGVQFLVQLEFAARLAGKVGTKDYGSLSIFTQLRAQVVIDCKVDRVCFTPKPKVDSALVSLKPKADSIDPVLLNKVETVTKATFTQRRKMLKNAIRQFVGDDRINDCPIDLNRRPDSIRPEEYIALTEFIFHDS